MINRKVVIVFVLTMFIAHGALRAEVNCRAKGSQGNLVDFHVHPDQNRSLEEAAKLSQIRKVQFGIVEHTGENYRIKTDKDLRIYLDNLEKYPFYKGLQPIYPGWSKAFSKSILNRLDYVLMDALTMPEPDGTFARIWRPNFQVDDKEAFMKRYLNFSLSIINEEPITIFAWPTFLPACIAKDYDSLWTTKRMQRLIDAAVKRGIAIEINESAKVPNAKFIKLAKKAGAKFTFGSDSRDESSGKLDYGRQMIKECGLTEADLFVLQKKKIETDVNDGPVHMLSSDGFIRDWLILGAFPNPRNKLSTPEWGYNVDYLKSLGGEGRAKLTPETEVSFLNEAGQSEIARTVRAQTASSGVFHFDEIYGKTNYELAYAYSTIWSGKAQSITAYFGSNDQGKVWVNGELVHTYKATRSCTARQDRFTFAVKKGLNSVLVKICETWGDWAFVMEVFTEESLALESQRPLARILRDIEGLGLCFKDLAGDTMSVDKTEFPTVQWANPYEVEKLLGRFPLQVRWFDEQGKQVEQPQGRGRYTALAEGLSPDGIRIRRVKRLACGNPRALPTQADRKPLTLKTDPEDVSSIIGMANTGTDEVLGLSYLAPVKASSVGDGLSAGTYAKLMDRTIRKGQTCLYWLYLPEGYGETERKWPLILSLHGSFRQGHDLSRIGKPIPPRADEIRRDFPFVVVTPQCPDEYDAWPSGLLADLIDDVVQTYAVDARRVYVTGVSLGGRGSWSFACDYPDRVAAVVPVCGTYDHPERLHRIKGIPVWAFHGDQDRTVPFEKTKKIVDDLKASGSKIRFTVYEGAGHGISGRAYSTKALYEWLLQQGND